MGVIWCELLWFDREPRTQTRARTLVCFCAFAKMIDVPRGDSSTTTCAYLVLFQVCMSVYNTQMHVTEQNCWIV